MRWKTLELKYWQMFMIMTFPITILFLIDLKYRPPKKD